MPLSAPPSRARKVRTFKGTINTTGAGADLVAVAAATLIGIAKEENLEGTEAVNVRVSLIR